MDKRVLDIAPEFVNTLFGLQPAPLTPVWRRKMLEERGATKFCTYCRADQPIRRFGFSKVSADKMQPHCNPCRNIQSRARYNKSPKAKKRVTDTHRLKTYGMTPQDFDGMLHKQGGKCAICMTALMPGRSTHIDHCHKTGIVRALLCMGCNLHVGMVENLPADIERYREYVAFHKESTQQPDRIGISGSLTP